MNVPLFIRIVLALAAAFGCALIRLYESSDDGILGWLYFYAGSGLLFAAGVLIPYLDFGKPWLLRAAGLVVASTASYWCAVWVALDGPTSESPTWFAFTTASLTGAAIVMIAALSTIPLRFSRMYIVFGLLASVAGGPITSVTLPSDAFPAYLLGHAAWHTLICLAIYFGTPSTAVGAEVAALFRRDHFAAAQREESG